MLHVIRSFDCQLIIKKRSKDQPYFLKTPQIQKNSCDSTRPFAHGESETLPMGSLCFVCDLFPQWNCPWEFNIDTCIKKNRRIAHGIFRTNLYGLTLVNLTTRVVQPIRWKKKSKSGNHSTCWAHSCDVVLKFWQISWHVTNSIH